LYGFLSNFAAGAFYNGPIYISVKCYPKRSGLMTSLVLFSCGIGSAFFNFLSGQLINPKDMQPLIL